MNQIKIIADSTCDLSEELLEKYNISILPLMLSLDDKNFKDGVEIKVEDIYQWSDQTGKTPKTAAPTIGDAQEFLTPYVKENMDIIFFGISEAMSGTCNVMRLAAQSLDYQKLHVIDSKSLSTGIGLQVLRAADLVLQGKSIDDILEDIQMTREKVRASFVIDTLTFLHRGGRCSGVTAILANTLNLKPEIVVIDGKMKVGKKYRGNQSTVIMKYAKDREAELLKADPSRVFITHSGCQKEVIDSVKEYLRGLNYFNEIIETRAGGVISSHCGPNTLGVLYINQ